MYTLETVTLEELGGTYGKSIPGQYPTREDAFAAAVDYAQELAGPEREGYRRPAVSIVNDETHGLSVKVGNADVDPSYTLVYVVAPIVQPERVYTGRGYVACKL